jgi:hypothetical protein
MSDFLQEFSKHTEKFFSSNPADHNEANQFFTFLVNSVNNPEILITVLHTTESQKILYVLNIVLFELLTKKWSIFQVSHKVSIFTFGLKSLALHSQLFQDKRLVDYIVRLVVRIARLSWNEDLEFLKLPQYCEEFLMQGRDLVLIGMKIVKSLVVEMAAESEEQLLSHSRNSEMFKDWIVPVIFSQVFKCIKNHQFFQGNDFEVISEVVEVFALILQSCKKNDENEILLTLSHANYWDGLRDVWLVNQLVTIYELSTAHEKILKSILRVFNGILKLSSKVFEKIEQKIEIFERVLSKVWNILSEKSGLLYESVLSEFIILLSKVVRNPLSMTMMRTQPVDLFLEKMYLTTKEVLVTSQSESIIYSCLKFWDSVSTHMKDSMIPQVLFEIVKIYFKFILTSKELQVGDSMLANTSSLMAGISKYCSDHLVPWVVQTFSELTISFPSSVHQLSHLVHLLSVLICDSRQQFLQSSERKYKFKQSSQSSSRENYNSVIELSHLVFSLSSHLSSNDLIFPELQSSCIYFLSIFSKVFINSSTQTAQTVLESLSLKLGLICADGLLVQMISIIFSFSNTANLELYENCMTLFSDLSGFTKTMRRSGSSEYQIFCGNLKFLQENVEEIIEKWTQGELGFINRNLPCKARTVFVNSMFKLFYLARSKSLFSFEDMVRPLQNAVEEVSSNLSPEKAACLCCDLLGVCSSASNSEQYSEFFSWLSSRAEVVFKIFDLLGKARSSPLPLLKFLKELSFNRLERLKLICGSLLKFCVKILNLFLDIFDVGQVCANVYETVHKPLSVCLHILKNNITGDFVNTREVLKDETVTASVKLLLEKVLQVPAESITSSIKIFSVFYEILYFVSNNSILIKKIVFLLSPAQVSQFFEVIIEGCQSVQQFVCQLAYLTIKNLVHECIFKSCSESLLFCTDNFQAFRRMMRVLLIIAFGGEGKNFSLISFPLLGLINLFKDEYLKMVPSLYLIQGPDRVEM